MMNMFSILNPLLTGVMVAGEIALVGVVMLTRKEMRLRDQRRVAELAELQDALSTLQTKFDELSMESRERDTAPVQTGKRLAINLHPRAEALRMLRKGSDEQTVSETLNIPLADVTLLRKVSQILCVAKE